MQGPHSVRSSWPRRVGRIPLPIGLMIGSLMVAGACSGSTPAAVGSTATASRGPVAAGAPTNFTATWPDEPGACPDEPEDSDFMCYHTQFAWQSAAGSDTSFRIYEGWTGEGDPMPTCTDLSADEIQQLLDTGPGARTAEHYAELSVGGGQECFWLTAVNDAGESAMVPADSNKPLE
jgi:hypothetical protein